jgi:hypothetical protein
MRRMGGELTLAYLEMKARKRRVKGVKKIEKGSLKKRSVIGI